MYIHQIAGDIVKLIREGKNKQAKDQYYSDGIVSIEGNGEKLEGIHAIHQKSADWAAQVAEVHSAHVSDPIVAADHFALHITMDISYKNGHRAFVTQCGTFSWRCSCVNSSGRSSDSFLAW